jgi:hypothetical protein
MGRILAKDGKINFRMWCYWEQLEEHMGTWGTMNNMFTNAYVWNCLVAFIAPSLLKYSEFNIIVSCKRLNTLSQLGYMHKLPKSDI